MFNTNHCNLAFEKQMALCENWLKRKVINACGYSSALLLERMMQQLVKDGIRSFALAVDKNGESIEDFLPQKGTRIKCGRATISVGSDEVRVTPKQWILSFIEFFVHWAYCLFAITFRKKSRNKLPAVILIGIDKSSLFTNNSDERFIEYCKFGPISVLRSGRRYIVESALNNTSSAPDEFEYSKRPFIELVRTIDTGMYFRAMLLFKQFTLLPQYFLAAIRFPQLSLIGKDFAYSRISQEMDKCNLLKSVVMSCSSFSHQSLWMRGLRNADTHMIWYSQNWKPITYVSDKTTSVLPHLRWIRVDKHWVWTKSFAEYLRKICMSTTFEAVGPIVWYMPIIDSTESSKIEISVFDVSPLNDDTVLEYGHITNYNSSKNLFLFINGILTLKNHIENKYGLDVNVRLKTKRGYLSSYDKDYFDYLEKLSSSGDIILEHHATNIYTLISRSCLTIIYPNSSPAYISESLNVPCVYFDPTNSIYPNDFENTKNLINYVGGEDELISKTVEILKNVSPKSILIE